MNLITFCTNAKPLVCYGSTLRKTFGTKWSNNSSITSKQISLQTRYLNSSSRHFPVEITRENIHELLSSFDTVLTDCDGVFWGNDLVTKFDGISNTIEGLRSLGKRILFVSNNSLLDRSAYLNKFRNYAGFSADKDEMFSVTYATAAYLKDHLHVNKCYMIGTEGLKIEIENLGIEILGYGPDPDPPSFDADDLVKMKLDDDVQAVVVGYDVHFHHNKIVKAASYLRNPDMHYIATNDKEMAVNLGEYHRQPVTGAFVTTISAVAGQKPLVLGKPHRHIMDCIRQKHPYIDMNRTIMIGDSLKIDIVFAKTVGLRSLLVLSGTSNLKDMVNLKEHYLLPEYYIDNFSNLGKLI